MKTFFFMAGLPHSGNPVISSILNQNSAIYVTPESPLPELLFLNEQQWKKNPSVIANHFPEQIKNISRAIINSTWEHINQDIIIDCHPAWASNTNIIKEYFGIEPKVIVLVRKISSIVASYLNFFKQTKSSVLDDILTSRKAPLIDELRCRLIWEEYILNDWNTLKQSSSDSIHFIEYESLLNPDTLKDSINSIYDFLDLQRFKHALYFETSTINPIEILGEKILNDFDSSNLEFWRNK